MIRRARHHLEDERLFARNAVNFAHLRQLRERLGEFFVSRFGGRVAADERGQLKAEQLSVELRRVSAHVTARFQPLDAVVHGGRFEADERAQLGKGRARVPLKGLQQPQVKFVQFGGFDRYIRPFFHNPEYYSANRLYYTAFIRARGTYGQAVPSPAPPGGEPCRGRVRLRPARRPGPRRGPLRSSRRPRESQPALPPSRLGIRRAASRPAGL